MHPGGFWVRSKRIMAEFGNRGAPVGPAVHEIPTESGLSRQFGSSCPGGQGRFASFCAALRTDKLLALYVGCKNSQQSGGGRGIAPGCVHRSLAQGRRL